MCGTVASTVLAASVHATAWDDDGVGQVEFSAVLRDGQVTTTRVVPPARSGPSGLERVTVQAVVTISPPIRLTDMSSLPVRERPPEVPVLALAEAVPGHVDGRAEVLVAVVELGDALALSLGHQLRRQRAPMLVDLAGDAIPVGAIDAVCPRAGCGVHAVSPARLRGVWSPVSLLMACLPA